MKLVNAGVKSKEDLARRLLDGEKLFFLDRKLTFNTQYNEPFRDGYHPMLGVWKHWDKVTMERAWYLDIAKPVPCYAIVGDFNYLVNIVEYKPSSHLPFIDSLGVQWKEAVPLTVDDLLQQ